MRLWLLVLVYAAITPLSFGFLGRNPRSADFEDIAEAAPEADVSYEVSDPEDVIIDSQSAHAGWNQPTEGTARPLDDFDVTVPVTPGPTTQSGFESTVSTTIDAGDSIEPKSNVGLVNETSKAFYSVLQLEIGIARMELPAFNDSYVRQLDTRLKVIENALGKYTGVDSVALRKSVIYAISVSEKPNILKPILENVRAKLQKLCLKKCAVEITLISQLIEEITTIKLQFTFSKKMYRDFNEKNFDILVDSFIIALDLLPSSQCLDCDIIKTLLLKLKFEKTRKSEIAAKLDSTTFNLLINNVLIASYKQKFLEAPLLTAMLTKLQASRDFYGSLKTIEIMFHRVPGYSASKVRGLKFFAGISYILEHFPTNYQLNPVENMSTMIRLNNYLSQVIKIANQTDNSELASRVRLFKKDLVAAGNRYPEILVNEGKFLPKDELATRQPDNFKKFEATLYDIAGAKSVQYDKNDLFRLYKELRTLDQQDNKYNDAIPNTSSWTDLNSGVQLDNLLNDREQRFNSRNTGGLNIVSSTDVDVRKPKCDPCECVANKFENLYDRLTKYIDEAVQRPRVTDAPPYPLLTPPSTDNVDPLFAEFDYVIQNMRDPAYNPSQFNRTCGPCNSIIEIVQRISPQLRNAFQDANIPLSNPINLGQDFTTVVNQLIGKLNKMVQTRKLSSFKDDLTLLIEKLIVLITPSASIPTPPSTGNVDPLFAELDYVLQNMRNSAYNPSQFNRTCGPCNSIIEIVQRISPRLRKTLQDSEIPLSHPINLGQDFTTVVNQLIGKLNKMVQTRKLSSFKDDLTLLIEKLIVLLTPSSSIVTPPAMDSRDDPLFTELAYVRQNMRNPVLIPSKYRKKCGPCNSIDKVVNRISPSLQNALQNSEISLSYPINLGQDFTTVVNHLIVKLKKMAQEKKLNNFEDDLKSLTENLNKLLTSPSPVPQWPETRNDDPLFAELDYVRQNMRIPELIPSKYRKKCGPCNSIDKVVNRVSLPLRNALQDAAIPLSDPINLGQNFPTVVTQLIVKLKKMSQENKLNNFKDDLNLLVENLNMLLTPSSPTPRLDDPLFAELGYVRQNMRNPDLISSKYRKKCGPCNSINNIVERISTPLRNAIQDAGIPLSHPINLSQNFPAVVNQLIVKLQKMAQEKKLSNFDDDLKSLAENLNKLLTSPSPVPQWPETRNDDPFFAEIDYVRQNMRNPVLIPSKYRKKCEPCNSIDQVATRISPRLRNAIQDAAIPLSDPINLGQSFPTVVNLLIAKLYKMVQTKKLNNYKDDLKLLIENLTKLLESPPSEPTLPETRNDDPFFAEIDYVRQNMRNPELIPTKYRKKCGPCNSIEQVVKRISVPLRNAIQDAGILLSEPINLGQSFLTVVNQLIVKLKKMAQEKKLVNFEDDFNLLVENLNMLLTPSIPRQDDPLFAELAYVRQNMRNPELIPSKYRKKCGPCNSINKIVKRISTPLRNALQKAEIPLSEPVNLGQSFPTVVKQLIVKLKKMAQEKKLNNFKDDLKSLAENLNKLLTSPSPVPQGPETRNDDPFFAEINYVRQNMRNPELIPSTYHRKCEPCDSINEIVQRISPSLRNALQDAGIPLSHPINLGQKFTTVVNQLIKKLNKMARTKKINNFKGDLNQLIENLSMLLTSPSPIPTPPAMDSDDDSLFAELAYVRQNMRNPELIPSQYHRKCGPCDSINEIVARVSTPLRKALQDAQIPLSDPINLDQNFPTVVNQLIEKFKKMAPESKLKGFKGDLTVLIENLAKLLISSSSEPTLPETRSDDPFFAEIDYILQNMRNPELNPYQYKGTCGPCNSIIEIVQRIKQPLRNALQDAGIPLSHPINLGQDLTTVVNQLFVKLQKMTQEKKLNNFKYDLNLLVENLNMLLTPSPPIPTPPIIDRDNDPLFAELVYVRRNMRNPELIPSKYRKKCGPCNSINKIVKRISTPLQNALQDAGIPLSDPINLGQNFSTVVNQLIAKLKKLAHDNKLEDFEDDLNVLIENLTKLLESPSPIPQEPVTRNDDPFFAEMDYVRQNMRNPVLIPSKYRKKCGPCNSINKVMKRISKPLRNAIQNAGVPLSEPINLGQNFPTVVTQIIVKLKRMEKTKKLKKFKDNFKVLIDNLTKLLTSPSPDPTAADSDDDTLIAELIYVSKAMRYPEFTPSIYRKKCEPCDSIDQVVKRIVIPLQNAYQNAEVPVFDPINLSANFTIIVNQLIVKLNKMVQIKKLQKFKNDFNVLIEGFSKLVTSPPVPPSIDNDDDPLIAEIIYVSKNMRNPGFIPSKYRQKCAPCTVIDQLVERISTPLRKALRDEGIRLTKPINLHQDFTVIIKQLIVKLKKKVQSKKLKKFKVDLKFLIENLKKLIPEKDEPITQSPADVDFLSTTSEPTTPKPKVTAKEIEITTTRPTTVIVPLLKKNDTSTHLNDGSDNAGGSFGGVTAVFRPRGGEGFGNFSPGETFEGAAGDFGPHGPSGNGTGNFSPGESFGGATGDFGATGISGNGTGNFSPGESFGGATGDFGATGISGNGTGNFSPGESFGGATGDFNPHESSGNGTGNFSLGESFGGATGDFGATGISGGGTGTFEPGNGSAGSGDRGQPSSENKNSGAPVFSDNGATTLGTTESPKADGLASSESDSSSSGNSGNETSQEEKAKGQSSGSRGDNENAAYGDGESTYGTTESPGGSKGLSGNSSAGSSDSGQSGGVSGASGPGNSGGSSGGSLSGGGQGVFGPGASGSGNSGGSSGGSLSGGGQGVFGPGASGSGNSSGSSGGSLSGGGQGVFGPGASGSGNSGGSSGGSLSGGGQGVFGPGASGSGNSGGSSGGSLSGGGQAVFGPGASGSGNSGGSSGGSLSGGGQAVFVPGASGSGGAGSSGSGQSGDGSGDSGSGSSGAGSSGSGQSGGGQAVFGSGASGSGSSGAGSSGNGQSGSGQAVFGSGASGSGGAGSSGSGQSGSGQAVFGSGASGSGNSGAGSGGSGQSGDGSGDSGSGSSGAGSSGSGQSGGGQAVFGPGASGSSGAGSSGSGQSGSGQAVFGSGASGSGSSGAGSSGSGQSGDGSGDSGSGSSGAGLSGSGQSGSGQAVFGSGASGSGSSGAGSSGSGQSGSGQAVFGSGASGSGSSGAGSSGSGQSGDGSGDSGSGSSGAGSSGSGQSGGGQAVFGSGASGSGSSGAGSGGSGQAVFGSGASGSGNSSGSSGGSLSGGGQGVFGPGASGSGNSGGSSGGSLSGGGQGVFGPGASGSGNSGGSSGGSLSGGGQAVFGPGASGSGNSGGSSGGSLSGGGQAVFVPGASGSGGAGSSGSGQSGDGSGDSGSGSSGAGSSGSGQSGGGQAVFGSGASGSGSSGAGSSGNGQSGSGQAVFGSGASGSGGAGSSGSGQSGSGQAVFGSGASGSGNSGAGSGGSGQSGDGSGDSGSGSSGAGSSGSGQSGGGQAVFGPGASGSSGAGSSGSGQSGSGQAVFGSGASGSGSSGAGSSGSGQSGDGSGDSGSGSSGAGLSGSGQSGSGQAVFGSGASGSGSSGAGSSGSGQSGSGQAVFGSGASGSGSSGAGSSGSGQSGDGSGDSGSGSSGAGSSGSGQSGGGQAVFGPGASGSSGAGSSGSGQSGSGQAVFGSGASGSGSSGAGSSGSGQSGDGSGDSGSGSSGAGLSGSGQSGSGQAVFGSGASGSGSSGAGSGGSGQSGDGSGGSGSGSSGAGLSGSGQSGSGQAVFGSGASGSGSSGAGSSGSGQSGSGQAVFGSGASGSGGAGSSGSGQSGSGQAVFGSGASGSGSSGGSSGGLLSGGGQAVFGSGASGSGSSGAGSSGSGQSGSGQAVFGSGASGSGGAGSGGSGQSGDGSGDSGSGSSGAGSSGSGQSGSGQAVFGSGASGSGSSGAGSSGSGQSGSGQAVFGSGASGSGSSGAGSGGSGQSGDGSGDSGSGSSGAGSSGSGQSGSGQAVFGSGASGSGSSGGLSGGLLSGGGQAVFGSGASGSGSSGAGSSGSGQSGAGSGGSGSGSSGAGSGGSGQSGDGSGNSGSGSSGAGSSGSGQSGSGQAVFGSGASGSGSSGGSSGGLLSGGGQAVFGSGASGSGSSGAGSGGSGQAVFGSGASGSGSSGGSSGGLLSGGGQAVFGSGASGSGSSGAGSSGSGQSEAGSGGSGSGSSGAGSSGSGQSGAGSGGSGSGSSGTGSSGSGQSGSGQAVFGSGASGSGGAGSSGSGQSGSGQAVFGSGASGSGSSGGSSGGLLSGGGQAVFGSGASGSGSSGAGSSGSGQSGSGQAVFGSGASGSGSSGGSSGGLLSGSGTAVFGSGLSGGGKAVFDHDNGLNRRSAGNGLNSGGSGQSKPLSGSGTAVFGSGGGSKLSPYSGSGKSILS